MGMNEIVAKYSVAIIHGVGRDLVGVETPIEITERGQQASRNVMATLINMLEEIRTTYMPQVLAKENIETKEADNGVQEDEPRSEECQPVGGDSRG